AVFVSRSPATRRARARAAPALCDTMPSTSPLGHPSSSTRLTNASDCHSGNSILTTEEWRDETPAHRVRPTASRAATTLVRAGPLRRLVRQRTAAGPRAPRLPVFASPSEALGQFTAVGLRGALPWARLRQG